MSPRVVRLTRLIVANHAKRASPWSAGWRLHTILAVGRATPLSARQLPFAIPKWNAPSPCGRTSRDCSRANMTQRAAKSSLFCRRERPGSNPRHYRTVAIVNEDRSLPRQHIVRVLRGTPLPASSLVSAVFAFRWRPWLCGEIRGCCRRYCRQESGGGAGAFSRSAGHRGVCRATVYAVGPVSPVPVPSSMSRTSKPAAWA